MSRKTSYFKNCVLHLWITLLGEILHMFMYPYFLTLFMNIHENEPTSKFFNQFNPKTCMNKSTQREPSKIGENLRSIIGNGTFNPTQTENEFAKTTFNPNNNVPVQHGTEAFEQKALQIKQLVKPGDYGKVINVKIKGGEEKEMHHYTLKMFWKIPTNGKDSYVLTGQDCYDTYLKNRRTHRSVFRALVSKFNEKIMYTQHMILYDNSEYGKVVKLIEYDGVKIHLDEKIKGHILVVNNRLAFKS